MKKFFTLILMAAFLAVPLPSLAGPAFERPVAVTQPDGTRVVLTQRGDEFLHWMEDSDGNAVVRTRSGCFEFAKPDGSGGLAASGVLCAPGSVPPSGAVKNFIPAKEMTSSARKNYAGPASLKTSSAKAAAAKTWTSNPISGMREALFIRVNFQDIQFKSSSNDSKAQIWGAEHSVRSYYLDQSRGKLNIVSADFGAAGKKDIIEITMTSADYNGGKHPDRLLSDTSNGGDYYVSHKNEVAFVNSVLRRTGLDFGQFDRNGDGIVEVDELVVYLLLAGYEESASYKKPAVWMHAWNSWNGDGAEHIVYASNDIVLEHWSSGGELTERLVQSQDVTLPLVGGIAHELGHQICKLPDLYDTNYVNNGLGVFSVMASGSWGCRANAGEIPGATPPNLDAWSRKYLGWDTPNTLTPNGAPVRLTCGVPRNGSFPVARVNSPLVDSTFEYILAEVRNPNAADWDGGISGGIKETSADVPSSFKGGILLQHIDERAGSGSLSLANDFNTFTDKGHQGNMAIWANGDSRAKGASQGNYLSLWYAGNGAKPDTYFYGTRDAVVAKEFSGITFASFSPSGETVSAAVARAGTGGGCGAGVGALALFALIPMAYRRKQPRRK